MYITLVIHEIRTRQGNTTQHVHDSRPVRRFLKRYVGHILAGTGFAHGIVPPRGVCGEGILDC